MRKMIMWILSSKYWSRIKFKMLSRRNCDIWREGIKIKNDFRCSFFTSYLKQSLKSIESLHIFKINFFLSQRLTYLCFLRQDKMFRSLQRLTFFRLSKFQAAAKAIKQSGKQQWTQKITPQEQAQLWSLYKQATEGPQADLPPWASNIHEPSSPRYWSRYQGRTKEQAEEDYVQVVKNVLMRHGGQKYIDGF